MNFQGRLTNSSGVAMSDGLYNMTFRIYDAATAGTLQWSEVREVANRVQVTNGLFSTQLGDVTSLPPSIFTNQNLYFEIELPSPATATCSTTACASYSEGPMTARSKLATSAYAFNADQLDGIDSSGFVQSTTTPQSGNIAVQSASAGSSALLVKGATSQTANVVNIQNASGTNLLSVSSSGSVQIGDATNNIILSATGIVSSGTARSTKQISLTAEYEGATLAADGSGNNGTLTASFCSGADRLNINASVCGNGITRGYYEWSNAQATVQDYDIYVRYQIPSDYSSGSLANLSILGWGTTTASEVVSATMYTDTTATACSSTGNAVTANATWSSATVATALGSCTVSAGDTVTFKVRVAAGQNNLARASTISFSYRSRF